MNTRMLMAVVVMMFVGQRVHAQAEATELEGIWEVVSWALEGVEQETLAGHLRRFEGNTRYFRAPEDEDWTSFGTFSLDPSTMPAEMDVDSEIGALLGIYELDDDLLRICIGIPGRIEPGTRPDVFESTEDYPTVLTVFRRVEDDE